MISKIQGPNSGQQLQQPPIYEMKHHSSMKVLSTQQANFNGERVIPQPASINSGISSVPVAGIIATIATPTNTKPTTVATTKASALAQTPVNAADNSLPSVLKNVDNYIVFNEKLGGGQFSQVYKAMDKNDKTHQKYFAVKVIPTSSVQFTKFANYNQQLQKEIEILLKMRHENLLCLHDLKQTPNNLYLFLDYCNGGDLRNLLKKKKRIAEEEAVEYFKQMCAGYKSLHELKIIHRDLKPENVLLHEGRIKIGDFGFARNVDNLEQAERMTQKCSPLYAPPQILIDEGYSSKGDVWSMGCIFFEMLYGHPPFNAVSIVTLIENIKKLVGQRKYALPSYPPIAPEASDLIQRMLMFHEKDRISWEDIFKHPLLAKHLSKKLVENLAIEPNSTPLFQSIMKNIDAVWDHNNQNNNRNGNQTANPAPANFTQTTIGKHQHQPIPSYTPLSQMNRIAEQSEKSPSRPYLPSKLGNAEMTTVPTTTPPVATQGAINNQTILQTQPPSQPMFVKTIGMTTNEPHTFHRHERRFSQTQTNISNLGTTITATTTPQSIRNTVVERSPSPISGQYSTNPAPNFMKRANSNAVLYQVPQHIQNNVSNENTVTSTGSSRQSPRVVEKRREIFTTSPNTRAGPPVVQRNFTQHNQTSEEPQRPSQRRETYSFLEKPSHSPSVRQVSPISSPISKPAQAPVHRLTTAPSLQQFEPSNPQQLLDKYSQLNNPYSTQSTKHSTNTIQYTQQQQTQQQQQQTQFTSYRSQSPQQQQPSFFQQSSNNNIRPTELPNYTTYQQQKEGFNQPREEHSPYMKQQQQNQQQQNISNIPQTRPTASSQSTPQQLASTQQKEIISKIEQDAELTENEKYVLYMKQIKAREAEGAFVSKINAFFGFMRKRALFANATLLNFWNSTRQLSLPSYLQCSILYCLCSYYYFALEQLRKILCKEIEQKVIKRDGFEVYQRSTEYIQMKDQIILDVSEAKQLFSDIQPFMISEIKLSTALEAQDFIRFISVAHPKHDDYRMRLQDLFRKAIQFLNTNAIDRSAAKGVHMVQIFTNIEDFVPSKQYNEFDFNRFYDDHFNNLQLEQFIAAINAFNMQYFKVVERPKLN